MEGRLEISIFFRKIREQNIKLVEQKRDMYNYDFVRDVPLNKTGKSINIVEVKNEGVRETNNKKFSFSNVNINFVGMGKREESSSIRFRNKIIEVSKRIQNKDRTLSI